jgi:RNA 3'-terminal phosphate cyclase-like protein
MPSDLKYQGCSLFRQRITAATLSGKTLKIEKIREKDDAPGLQDFEGNFLRLIEKIVDGIIYVLSRYWYLGFHFYDVAYQQVPCWK